jgi:hypothetical protein
MEFISEDILSKKCHINLGPLLNIYRVTFEIGGSNCILFRSHVTGSNDATLGEVG